MYPNYCSNCGVKLSSMISAYNLDNYYRDFYEAGIGFEIKCHMCSMEYRIIPENQEFAISFHKLMYPYNERKK